MSFRESSWFQGHLLKGMSTCLQTGICVYRLIPINLMCMIKLYYSHAVCIRLLLYFSYNYSFPVNILLIYILSLLSLRRFYFPAFTEQNVHMVGIISLSYFSFYNTANMLIVGSAILGCNPLAKKNKTQQTVLVPYTSPIRIPLKEMVWWESKPFRHRPKTVPMEVSCHPLSPLGQEQANKRHFLWISVLRDCCILASYHPITCFTYQGILCSALRMLTVFGRLVWKDC